MELTAEQVDIRKAAREFAEGEFRDRAQEFDEQEDFDLAIWKKACENGFVGAFIKEEYGGAGLGFFEHSLISEEFWRVDPGCGQAVLATTFGSEMIQAFGTEEQKKTYLPRLTSGEAIMGFGITESDAGSDVSALKTRAVKRGDHYLINGTKMFITNGCLAKFLLLFCVTNPEEKDPHRRHSAIIIDTSHPGYGATKIHGKMGIRASNTAELTLTDVEAPVGNLVGKEGNGFYQLMDFFNRTRLHVAAQGVGVAQGSLEAAMSYVKKRKAFGKTLGDLQGIQFKLAEMVTRVEAAQGTVLACRLSHGQGQTRHGPHLHGQVVRRRDRGVRRQRGAPAPRGLRLHQRLRHPAISTAMRRSWRSTRAQKRWRRPSSAGSC